MAKDSKDYEVGYGKPPKDNQFPKGQSGNPKGRPRGSRGLKTDLDEELKATVSIKFNGKVVKGTAQRLAMRTLATRAATGDVRAIKQLTDLVLQIFGSGDRGGDEDKLSAQDQQLLERFLGLNDEESANEPAPDSRTSDEGDADHNREERHG